MATRKSKKVTDAESTAPAAPAPSDKPRTREELMDERAAADFRHLDKVNERARAAAFRIMNERGAAHEPQPSGGTEPWRGYIGVDGPVASAARRLRGW